MMVENANAEELETESEALEIGNKKSVQAYNSDDFEDDYDSPAAL